MNPAKSRKNLTVYTNAHVTRILFEARRAIGVELKRGDSSGQTQRIRAKREVILSGGAINSPQVLQLSGIGPANLLNDLEIPLVHDLPGVGENLRDHYAPRFTARVKNIDTINEKARGPRPVSYTHLRAHETV